METTRFTSTLAGTTSTTSLQLVVLSPRPEESPETNWTDSNQDRQLVVRDPQLDEPSRTKPTRRPRRTLRRPPVALSDKESPTFSCDGEDDDPESYYY
ncbi:unnamed protein product [Cochlearia groenlandica]